MLVSFSFANYKSFKDENKISLVGELPDPNNEYSHPTPFGYSVLKAVAVYGANASGKSKLFAALNFFRSLICPPVNSDKIPTFDYWKNHYDVFRLSTATSEASSFFEATIIINDIQYRYGVELNANTILDEWCYRKKERETLILSRRLVDDGVLDTKIGKSYLNAKIYNNLLSAGMIANDVPLLTILAIFNDDLCKEITREFRSIKIISANETTPPIKALNNDNHKKEIIDFMRSFDFNIEDLTMHEIHPDDIPDKLKSIIGKDNIQGKLYDGVSTTHRLYDSLYEKVGTRQFMMEVDESFGTNRLLRLSWPIIQALKEGLTLFIDEIDSGLHSYIVSTLIKLFYNTKNNAQLIVNTQNTSLLSYPIDVDADNNKKYLLRKDQVYIVNKNRYGESNVYPITYFQKNIRTNLETLYMDGRFTGVPYIELDNILEMIADHESQE